MATFRTSNGWVPPWSFSGVPHAAVVVTTEADDAPVQVHAFGEDVGSFVSAFLEARLRSLEETDLSDEVSFLYVVLGRAPHRDEDAAMITDGGAVLEFGFGAAPSAPSAWPPVPLRVLLLAAIESLRREVH